MENEKDVQDIKERLVRIEVLLEQSSSTRALEIKSLEEKISVANHRIVDLEDTISWLWKTAISGLIVGAVGILFRFI